MSRISVIVPVRNEAAHIEQTLLCLFEQDLDPADFEVIVVDGQSDDATVAIVRRLQARFRNLKLLYNPKRLSSAARNVGVRHAAGDYCVVVDGHCAVRDRNYLANLAKAFAESGADTLGRPQPLRAPGATPFQEALATARESWLGHNPDSHIYAEEPEFVRPQNVAVAYRREVFAAVGLFDERFDACEDVEFNTRADRAGRTCYFTPAIRVDYHPRRSLRGLFYQMFRYGRGRARLGRKYPASLTVPSLVPALWLLWLPLALAAGLVYPPVLAVLGLSLLLYFGAIAAETARLSRGRLARLRYMPLIFVAIHAGFGWGVLREAWAQIRG